MERQASRGHGRNGSPSVDAGIAGVDPGDFAEYLRAERERRRLTLEQIADETKIASRHLEALERGDVRNWPGGMYRRAMMRAYAESIGVDREYALKQFEQAFDAPPPHAGIAAAAVDPPVPLPRWRPSRNQVLASGASAFALAAVMLGWTLAGSLTGDDPAAVPTAVADRAVGPAPPPATIPAARPPAATATINRTAAVQGAALQTAATRTVSERPPETAATTGSTEPRPLATEGTLVVTSYPAGARVTVNGIGWGETPVTIRHLEFGQKRIRLTMQDYISQERVVGLGPERPNANVRLTLPRRD